MDAINSTRVYQNDYSSYRVVQIQMAQSKYIKEQNNLLVNEKFYKIIFNVLYIFINILVLIVTILSFLVTTEVIDYNSKQWINIVIGILGIIITTIHNILNGNQIQAKKVLYKLMSKQYNSIIENLNTNTELLEVSEIKHNFIKENLDIV